MMVKPSSELQTRLFAQDFQRLHRKISHLFFWLLIVQWLLAITLSLLIAPYQWTGASRQIHPHVEIAVVLGGLLNALPLLLLWNRPDWWLTRQVVAVAQMLWSAILIHITGGRIETHFHIFGSLAFLALYRDWRLLITATLVVAADHLTRGFLWPESVYGIANPEWWRFLEHAAWMLFEDVVLTIGSLSKVAEMHKVADREAALEVLNGDIEQQVQSRTRELEVANQRLAGEMKSRLQMEAELRQAQKLESVGRLASGVAHEINTPVQFVSDSIHFVRDATGDLLDLLAKLQLVRREVEANEESGTAAIAAARQAAAAEAAADLPYLQAVLNIVINAAHAIADVVKGTNAKGRIRVRTRVEDGHAVVTISDTGGGIPEAIRERIFDPFFTTKEVGKGTGQGLAIARSVVVDKHRGELTVESEPGRGSTFLIRLPIDSALTHPQGVAA